MNATGKYMSIRIHTAAPGGRMAVPGGRNSTNGRPVWRRRRRCSRAGGELTRNLEQHELPAHYRTFFCKTRRAGFILGRSSYGPLLNVVLWALLIRLCVRTKQPNYVLLKFFHCAHETAQSMGTIPWIISKTKIF